MFLVKFFKGLKGKKTPKNHESLKEIKENHSNSLDFLPSISQKEKTFGEISKQESPGLPQISPHKRDFSLIEFINEVPGNKGKYEQKNKPLSVVELNNQDNWRNFQKKNKTKRLSIEPLKIKFREKDPISRKLSVSGKKKKKQKKNPEIKKESTVFDKIDKILAKSTAYQIKNKQNYEKDLIKILNKNMNKSKSLPPKKKASYLKRIFGDNQKNTKKPALKPLKPIEMIEEIKPTLNPNNNSNLDYFFEENSLRLMEWNEANSLQEIKNLNISELNLVFILNEIF